MNGRDRRRKAKRLAAKDATPKPPPDHTSDCLFWVNEQCNCALGKATS